MRQSVCIFQNQRKANLTSFFILFNILMQSSVSNSNTLDTYISTKLVCSIQFQMRMRFLCVYFFQLFLSTCSSFLFHLIFMLIRCNCVENEQVFECNATVFRTHSFGHLFEKIKNCSTDRNRYFKCTLACECVYV